MGRAKQAKRPAPPAWVEPGAVVDYASIRPDARGRGGVVRSAMVVRSLPWQLGDGTWVVRLRDVSGGVGVEYLSLVVAARDAVVDIARTLAADALGPDGRITPGEAARILAEAVPADARAEVRERAMDVLASQVAGDPAEARRQIEAHDAARRLLSG